MPAYLSILRPGNGIMSAIAVWIGALLAGTQALALDEMFFPVYLAMIAVFLVTGAGMIVNDIFDIEIDRVNRPKRPLPSGRIGKGAAAAYALVFFVIGNVIGIYLGVTAFYFTFLATVLLIVYAWKLKKVIGVGHVIVAFLVALSFVFGSFVGGELMASVWLAALAFFSTIGREVYKTIDDIMGDKKAGVDNIAVRFGVLRAKIVAGVFTLLAVALSFAPYLLGIMNEVYLFFVIIADIAFLATVASPVRYSSKLSKLAMIIALIAFVVGSIGF